MDNYGVIIGLVVVLYIIAEIFKATFVKTDRDRAILPFLCAIVGGVLGLVIFIAAPEIIGTNDVFTAIIDGIISGLAATGGNQFIKQIKKRVNDASNAILGIDDDNSNDLG